jgi:hypothetical protein
VRLARRRWRIHGKVATWYAEMARQHETALELCNQAGVTIRGGRPGTGYSVDLDGRAQLGWAAGALTRGGTLLLDPSGRVSGVQYGGLYRGPVRFNIPIDFRRAGTYGRSVSAPTYGLPIQDYDDDLASLAWLAGGDASEPLWRNWVEVVLWRFVELPMSNLPKPWLETGRNRALTRLPRRLRPDIRKIPENWPKPRKLLNLPPFTTVTVDSGVNLHLLSRWTRLGEYPDEVQPGLVYSIIQRWGSYEEPPDRANMRRELEALLKPSEADGAYRRAEELVSEDADLIEFGEVDRLETTAARQRRFRRSNRPSSPG